MIIKAPKGTRDILPNEVYKWQYIEKIFSDVCNNYGLKEIRIPVFESTDLFERGVGDDTDIVQKEMYTFLDKAGRSLTLRPEGTAGVVRSYIENGMASSIQPIKLYYNISAYRYENVQKGRYREFHQFGAEVFGSDSPLTDVEIISMISVFLRKIGLKKVKLNINSIGCTKCRKDYIEKLKKFAMPYVEDLCDMCKLRIHKNPLRLIDCKEDKCKSILSNAPSIFDSLCEGCSTHFEEVKTGLENLEIDYSIDKTIVRGLDYYTKTVFEFISNNIGSQGTICGGGRYDGLVKELNGPDTQGIGFAAGVERLLLCMEAEGVIIQETQSIDVFIAAIEDNQKKLIQNIVYKLRCRGINAEMDVLGRSLKAQLRYADKIKAKYSLVIGEEEVIRGRASLRNMKTKECTEVNIDNVEDEIEIVLKNLI